MLRFSRTLALHLAVEIFKIFALVLAIQVVIFGAIFTFKATRDYGFDLGLLLPIFRITFAYSLYYTIPIAALVATGLVFGRFVADREIAAMKSFGISHLEMLIAPAAIGVVLMAAGLYINGYVIPEVRFAKDNLGKLLLDQLQSLDEGYDKSFFLDDDKKNKIVIERYREGRLSNIFLFAEEPERVFPVAADDDDLIDDEDSDDDTPDDGSRDGDPRGRREQDAREGDRNGSARSRESEGVTARSFPLILHAREGAVLSQAEGVVLELRDVRVFYDNDFRGSGERDVPPERRDFLQNARLSRLPVPIAGFDDKSRVQKAMPNPLLRDFIRRKLEEHQRLEAELEAALQSATEPNEEMRRRSRRALNQHRKAKGIYQRRITFALVSLTFPVTIALIALSLNSSNRLLPFFVGSVVCCGLFFPLEMQGYELARSGDASYLEHLGNAALFALAAILLLRLEHWSLRRIPARAGRPATPSVAAGDAGDGEGGR